jgi:hypothetical protein
MEYFAGEAAKLAVRDVGKHCEDFFFLLKRFPWMELHNIIFSWRKSDTSYLPS